MYRRTVSAGRLAPVLFEPLDASGEHGAPIRLPRDLLALTTDHKLNPMQVGALMRLKKPTTSSSRYSKSSLYFSIQRQTKTRKSGDVAESSIAKRCSAASVSRQIRGEAERMQQRINAYAPGQLFQHIAANTKFVVDRPGLLLNKRRHGVKRCGVGFGHHPNRCRAVVATTSF